MPSRNVLRRDYPHSYYHVYSRGVGKSSVFLEANDKDYFLHLIARHLSLKPAHSRDRYAYPHLRNQLELLCYCLMDNHFHLLFYQIEQGALSRLMKSIITAYVAYFNRKYKRTGPLFESRFKAANITSDAHLTHISRYIHLNPRSWRRFQYSSAVHIDKGTEPEWLQSEKIIETFSSKADYLKFVSEYEENKLIIDSIKSELANM